MPNEENLHQRGGVQLNDLNAEGGLPEGQQMNDLNESNKVTVAGQEKKWLNGDYGYPFPMGPLIPLPDLKHPPLWPGLLKEDLNRLEAAAKVVYEVYRNRANDEDSIKKGKETLGALMDAAFNNFLKHADPKMELQGEEPTLGLLEEWKGKIKNIEIKRDCFSDLLDRRLKFDIRGLHERERPPLMFSMGYYPTIGQKFEFNVSAGLKVMDWPECYGQETQDHMSSLLGKPDGIWTVMALLFNKLLHAHMGWLVPNKIQDCRRKLYYEPVLRLLERCARQAVEEEAHPLSRTAAGIWMNFRCMKGLFVVDNNDVFIDPRDENLPDSLHMDSAMWVDRCMEEVMEIFRRHWIGDKDMENRLGEVEGLMQDVCSLAWGIASCYTDPFSAGGLNIGLPSITEVAEGVNGRVADLIGSQGEDKNKVKKIGYERLAGDYEGMKKSLVILKEPNPLNLTERQLRKLNHLPKRFRECRIDDWGVFLGRLGQLKVCCEKIHQMLLNYGLNQFQARQGNQP